MRSYISVSSSHQITVNSVNDSNTYTFFFNSLLNDGSQRCAFRFLHELANKNNTSQSENQTYDNATVALITLNVPKKYNVF